MRKIAILIDGGFFLKRLKTVFPSVDHNDANAVCGAISKLVASHLQQQNKIERAAHPRALLYRVFYYDAVPYAGKSQYPVSKANIDFSKSDLAIFRSALFDKLRRFPNTAVRLGEVRKERSWTITERAQKQLLRGDITVGMLTDDDFVPGLGPVEIQDSHVA